MKCARCEAEEDRINGFCSIYCEDMAEVKLEVARLNHENGKLEEEARALREALRGYMFGGSLDSLKAALGEDALIESMNQRGKAGA